MIAEFNFIDSLISAFVDFGETIAKAVPRLIMVLVVVLAGYMIARIAAYAITKALNAVSFDDVTIKMKLDEPLKIVGIKSLSVFLGKVVHWLIMFVVIKSAADKLAIEIVSQQIEKIYDFIPALLSAILIILATYFLAVKLKEVITNITRSLGSNAGAVLANILYYFIMIMGTITAIEQTGIGTDLISNNILLIIGSVLFAGAVAYGYAARGIMQNMLSSFFGKRNFYKGQKIKVKDLQGEIIEMDSISVTVKTADGKVIMPAKELLENTVEILD
jgi:TRAP-type mannitol/chloroaromatic compound transport system permease small subunit